MTATSMGITKQQPFEPTGAPQTSAVSSEVPTVSIQSSLGPYGDPGGIRSFLDAKGIDYTFTYITDDLVDVSGGLKRGTAYVGRLDGRLTVDLEKLRGLDGLTFQANFYQISGRSVTTNNVADLLAVSTIDAYPDTKLYNAWFEQKLLGGKVAVKAGQIALDTEFIVSQTASLFVNSTYGYPAIFATDLPSQGISYPYAAPAAQIRYQPSEAFSLTTIVLDGDPAKTAYRGMPNYATGSADAGGVAFRVEDAPLLLSEAEVIYNNGKSENALPGTVRIGYMHHFGRFQTFDVAPAAATTYRGNDGAYILIDQSLYRAHGRDGGLSAFLRVMGAPSDRNLFDRYIDAGFSFQGVLPGRERDSFGIAGAFARVSPAVTPLDVASGSAPMIRAYQSQVEATYQYVVVNGFTVQPDVQYIMHPGANGVVDPPNERPLRNAVVVGTRVTVVY